MYKFWPTFGCAPAPNGMPGCARLQGCQLGSAPRGPNGAPCKESRAVLVATIMKPEGCVDKSSLIRTSRRWLSSEAHLLFLAAAAAPSSHPVGSSLSAGPNLSGAASHLPCPWTGRRAKGPETKQFEKIVAGLNWPCFADESLQADADWRLRPASMGERAPPLGAHRPPLEFAGPRIDGRALSRAAGGTWLALRRAATGAGRLQEQSVWGQLSPIAACRPNLDCYNQHELAELGAEPSKLDGGGGQWRPGAASRKRACWPARLHLRWAIWPPEQIDDLLAVVLGGRGQLGAGSSKRDCDTKMMNRPCEKYKPLDDKTKTSRHAFAKRALKGTTNAPFGRPKVGIKNGFTSFVEQGGKFVSMDEIGARQTVSESTMLSQIGLGVGGHISNLVRMFIFHSNAMGAYLNRKLLSLERALSASIFVGASELLVATSSATDSNREPSFGQKSLPWPANGSPAAPPAAELVGHHKDGHSDANKEAPEQALSRPPSDGSPAGEAPTPTMRDEANMDEVSAGAANLGPGGKGGRIDYGRPAGRSGDEFGADISARRRANPARRAGLAPRLAGFPLKGERDRLEANSRGNTGAGERRRPANGRPKLATGRRRRRRRRTNELLPDNWADIGANYLNESRAAVAWTPPGGEQSQEAALQSGADGGQKFFELWFPPDSTQRTRTKSRTSLGQSACFVEETPTIGLIYDKCAPSLAKFCSVSIEQTIGQAETVCCCSGGGSGKLARDQGKCFREFSATQAAQTSAIRSLNRAGQGGSPPVGIDFG